MRAIPEYKKPNAWRLVSLLGALLVCLVAYSHVEAQTNTAGTQANAWSAASVAISGTSAALNTLNCRTGITTAFGNTSGAATLTVQYSQNGTTFYSSATTTGAVTGNFGLSFQHGARYVRLISNAAVDITATLACK